MGQFWQRASFIVHVTLILRPLGMGLWSHGLSSALDLLNLCLVRRSLVSRLLPALGTTVSGMVVQPCPGRVPGLFILHTGGMIVYLEVDYKFCFSLQVVIRCSLLRVLRSMCAAGRRLHTFSRAFHFMLFTLARVLSSSLDVLFLMCFLRDVPFPVFVLCPSQPVYTPACRTGARWWHVLVNGPQTLRQRGVRVQMVRLS